MLYISQVNLPMGSNNPNEGTNISTMVHFELNQSTSLPFIVIEEESLISFSHPSGSDFNYGKMLQHLETSEISSVNSSRSTMNSLNSLIICLEKGTSLPLYGKSIYLEKITSPPLFELTSVSSVLQFCLANRPSVPQITFPRCKIYVSAQSMSYSFFKDQLEFIWSLLLILTC